MSRPTNKFQEAKLEMTMKIIYLKLKCFFAWVIGSKRHLTLPGESPHTRARTHILPRKAVHCTDTSLR